MSMNLNLKIDGEKIGLFQTPTGISYMCETHLPMKGKGSKKENMKVMETYIIQVEQVLYSGGVFKSDEEYQEYNVARTHAFEHTNRIRKLISNAKTIEAYVM